MITFEKTDKKDFNELKHLWKSCFDENEKAIDLFFEKAMKFTDVYCAKLNGKIVSAIYLIKASLNDKKAHYIFAVATLSEYRGKGIMRNLMEYSLNDAKNNGDVYSLLFPANEKLYDFYKKFGYVESCTARHIEFTRKELEAVSTADSNKRCDLEMLQKECLKNNFLLWNNNFVQFVKDYYGIYEVKCIQNSYCFALIDEHNDQADIIYSLYTNFSELKKAILANTNAEKVRFALKSDSKLCINKKSEKCGMIKSLDNTEIPDDVYIGITLN